jgi:CheY-like chemotaxis protein
MKYSDIEILFAEDNEDDAILTIQALSKSGFADKLHHVKDGAEALDYVYCRGDYSKRNTDEPPKIIMLDLKMPKLSGVEVLSTLKADPNLKSIPVVVLTSSSEDPDIEAAYALGAEIYIVKPVNSENFSQVIKEVIRTVE